MRRVDCWCRIQVLLIVAFLRPRSKAYIRETESNIRGQWIIREWICGWSGISQEEKDRVEFIMIKQAEQIDVMQREVFAAMKATPF